MTGARRRAWLESMATSGNVSVVSGSAPTGFLPTSQVRGTAGQVVRSMLGLVAGQLLGFVVCLRLRRILVFQEETAGGLDFLADTTDDLWTGTDPVGMVPKTTLPVFADPESVQVVKSYSSPDLTIAASVTDAAATALAERRQPLVEGLFLPTLRTFSIQGLIDRIEDATAPFNEDPAGLGWGASDSSPVETLVRFHQRSNKVVVEASTPEQFTDGAVPFDPQNQAHGNAIRQFLIGGIGAGGSLLVDLRIQPAAASSSSEFFESGGVLS